MPIPRSVISRTGALLVRAARAGQERANERLETLGLNVRMCSVLNVLAAEGPRSQQELGAMLNIDRTTMVELIDDLEREGMVRRATNPNDRRSHLIQLRPDARAKTQRALQAFNDAADEFFAPLTAAERRQLGEILQKLLT